MDPLPSFVAPLAGGLLIGLAVAMLLLLDGRVAGISGIVAGVMRPPSANASGARHAQASPEWRWRASFVAGLLVAGVAARIASAHAFGSIAAPLPILAIAGLLVGVGTRLGGGCTSGHGVCGVSRAAPRSIVATATFMIVAALVVFLVRHGVGR